MEIVPLYEVSSVSRVLNIDNRDVVRTIRYFGEEKVVKVPDTYNGMDVYINPISGPVFRNNKYIEKVILPKTTETLSSSLFKNCVNLKSVVLPKALIYADENAFRDTKYLEKAKPGWILNKKMDMLLHIRLLKI